VISGRPARGIVNDYIILGEAPEAPPVPDYPRAYYATRAMSVAANVAGVSGYSVQLAGQGAMLSRAMPAADLVATLRAELNVAITNLDLLTTRA